MPYLNGFPDQLLCTATFVEVAGATTVTAPPAEHMFSAQLEELAAEGGGSGSVQRHQHAPPPPPAAPLYGAAAAAATTAAGPGSGGGGGGGERHPMLDLMEDMARAGGSGEGAGAGAAPLPPVLGAAAGAGGGPPPPPPPPWQACPSRPLLLPPPPPHPLPHPASPRARTLMATVRPRACRPGGRWRTTRPCPRRRWTDLWAWIRGWGEWRRKARDR